MSRRTQRPARRHRTSKQRTPDFEKVYGSYEELPTPRMAHALWRAAGDLADDWRCGGDEYEELLCDLPRCAERVADRAWVRSFAQCLQSLRDRFANGDIHGLPTCAAEELALFLILDHANFEVFLYCLDQDPTHQRLSVDALDEEFWLFARHSFPDSAIAELLQAREDGYYDVPDFDHRMYGLRPQDWFTTLSLG